MRAETDADRTRRVRGALRAIRDERPDAASSLVELAASVGLSAFHFHRLFRERTGRGVAGHRRSLRLVRAAHRLASTDDRILDIALSSGYATEDGFRRAFRREFDTTPSAYRRSRKDPAMTDVSIGFVKIPVSDLNRSAAFFRDTLGLTEDFVVPAYGWGQFSTGTIPLCLYVPGAGGGTEGTGVTTGIQFRTADARAAHARIQAAEGASTTDLTEGDDGTLAFEFTDPDGNRFQMAQVA